MNQVNFNKRHVPRTRAEKFLYEMRPFSLVFISFYSMIYPTHTVMAVCGAVLAFCAFMIFSWRLRYRGYFGT